MDICAEVEWKDTVLIIACGFGFFFLVPIYGKEEEEIFLCGRFYIPFLLFSQSSRSDSQSVLLLVD